MGNARIEVSDGTGVRLSSKKVVFVAGHRGLLGRALVRQLEKRENVELCLATRGELDLRDARSVREFFDRRRPDQVFLAAAHVGGIDANQREPATFICDNLAIELSVIRAAAESRVADLLMFGSSCMYPRMDAEIVSEADLYTGPVEETSRAYAVAKLAGFEMCRAFRAQLGVRFFCMVPATIYGPFDHFFSERPHVVPALMRRFHRAVSEREAEVAVFGSGEALREFVYCDDVARAAVELSSLEDPPELVNVGSGEEVRISELARSIADIVGYAGRIVFDRSKPEGARRKALDSAHARALGWSPGVELRHGLERSYRWYVEELERRAAQRRGGNVREETACVSL